MGEAGSSRRPGNGVLRQAVVTVPAVLLLGWISGKIGDSGYGNLWFARLDKPAIMPPGWVFGFVWSILYVMMGAALAVILDAREARGRGIAIALFVIQLALNLAWSPLFFGAHQITGALMLIGFLDAAVVVTIVLFWRIRPAAALLLTPYLVWIVFATFLNWELRLNNLAMDGREIPAPVTRIEF